MRVLQGKMRVCQAAWIEGQDPFGIFGADSWLPLLFKKACRLRTQNDCERSGDSANSASYLMREACHNFNLALVFI